MRPRLLLALVIAAPAVAFAQSAPPTAGRIVAPPPAIAPAPTPAPRRLPQLAPIQVAAQDPGECRAGCAGSRYMCRSSHDLTSCDSIWRECVDACMHPDPDAPTSAAP
jgi:hypothetical protein